MINNDNIYRDSAEMLLDKTKIIMYNTFIELVQHFCRSSMSEINLKRLAELTGLSKTTVSYVFNNHPGIPEQTRNRVLTLARKYNYRPNYFAQALNTGKTRTLGVLFTNALGVFMGEIMKGLEDVIYKYGYHALICTCNDDQEREKSHLEMLLHKGVDGIIAFFVTEGIRKKTSYSHWLDLKKRGIPLVFIDRYLPGENIDFVTCDDFSGTYDLVTYLISLGHRRIACLCKKDSCTSIKNRLAGYKKALADAGIEVNKDYIIFSDADDENINALTTNFLTGNDSPSAIFAVTDSLAIAIRGKIKQAGLRIPDDIALAGFGNSPESAVLPVPLTTVSQPREELGQKAAEILFNQLNSSPSGAVNQIMIKPELIIRESSGNKLIK